MIEQTTTEPGRLNIGLYRKNRWSVELVFTWKPSGDPIDFSTATLKLQIKRNIRDTTYVKQLTVGSGLTVSGTGSNIVTILTQANIPAGSYVYDLTAFYAGSDPITYLKGSLTVEQNVSE
jgi:hypothetical protein